MFSAVIVLELVVGKGEIVLSSRRRKLLNQFPEIRVPVARPDGEPPLVLHDDDVGTAGVVGGRVLAVGQAVLAGVVRAEEISAYRGEVETFNAVCFPRFFFNYNSRIVCVTSTYVLCSVS